MESGVLTREEVELKTTGVYYWIDKATDTWRFYSPYLFGLIRSRNFINQHWKDNLKEALAEYHIVPTNITLEAEVSCSIDKGYLRWSTVSYESVMSLDRKFYECIETLSEPTELGLPEVHITLTGTFYLEETKEYIPLGELIDEDFLMSDIILSVAEFSFENEVYFDVIGEDSVRITVDVFTTPDSYTTVW